jgi:glutamate transport system substrate-binding protein
MRITRYAATLGALGLVLAGCSSEAGQQAAEATSNAPEVAQDVQFPAGSTMARLAEAGTITIGTKFDQPGFGLANPQGVPEGFDVEVAKIVAGGLGIAPEDIEWKETVSANRESFIQNGDVDIVVATYTINDARKQLIDFAGPYYVAGQDIMVATGNPLGIEGPDDLAGKRVCSVEGSTPAQNIRDNYPEAQLTLFDVYSKCADALRTGQVQVVTTDNVILLGLASKADGAFKLVGKTFTQEPYGIGLKKGDTAFCQFISDTLKEAAGSGAYQKAWTSTAGSVAGAQQPTLPPADACS